MSSHFSALTLFTIIVVVTVVDIVASNANAALIVGGTFEELFIASIVPHIEFTSEFAMIFVAMLGTTISPYLFFWQTSFNIN